MLPAEGEPASDRYFHPASKCCTYHPMLPNFIVGRILADPDPNLAAAQSRLNALLAAATGVTPLGVQLHDPSGGRATNWESFGRDPSLRCQLYVEDAELNCGIWPHRNGLCLSWACKNSCGRRGARLRKTVELLLRAAEQQLSLWCLLELDVDPALLAAGLPPLGSPAAWRPEDARDLFGRCADLVEGLNWEDVAGIAGSRVRALASLAQEAHRQLLADDPPRRLAVGSFTVESLDSETVRLMGYSSYDPIELPSAILGALPSFDGAPLDVVRRRLAGQGLDLDAEAVQALVDFGILVDRDDPWGDGKA